MILDEIAAKTKVRVAELKSKKPLEQVKKRSHGIRQQHRISFLSGNGKGKAFLYL